MSDGTEAYRAAGVDLVLGNVVSEMLGNAAKHTWDDRAGRLGEMVEYGQDFSSFRAMPLTVLGNPDYLLSMGVDGVGTKVEAAERLEDHRTIAHDLIAMSCDDAVVRGGEPFAVATILDVRKFRDIPNLREFVGQLAMGYVEAAKVAGVTIINGETAELGDRVGGYGLFNYNWSSTALWIAHKSRVIDNSKIEPGNSLVAFREHGFRSNGLSLVRKTFKEFEGEEWHNVNIREEAQKLGELVLRPSIIYSKLMVELTGGYDLMREPLAFVHGAAHITGGGIPEKLGRVLRNTGYGAEIPEPFDPPYVMKLAQEHAIDPDTNQRIRDKTAYSTWNMGQGMVVVTPQADKVIEAAREHGVEAQEVGVVTRKAGIRIHSRGLDEARLEFPS